MSRPSSSSQPTKASPGEGSSDHNGSFAPVKLLSRQPQPASEATEGSSSKASASSESPAAAAEAALRDLNISETASAAEGEDISAGTSSNSQPSISLDETLSDALRSPRDRPFLLRQEQDMIDLISDASRDRHVLPLMNSYQRLLVHRCADYYSLHRDVDSETKVVTLSKTAETRLPSMRLPQLFAQIQSALRPEDISPFALLSGPSSGSVSPSVAASRSSTSSPALGSTANTPGGSNLPPAGFRIMRRDPSLGTGSGLHSSTPSPGHAGASSAGESSEPGKKSRREMTIEEREAAYREARQRIFGVVKDDSSSSGAESKDETQKPKEKTREKRSQASARSSAPALSADESATFTGDRRALPLADPAAGIGYYATPHQAQPAQWTPPGAQQPIQAQHTATAGSLAPLLSAGAPVFDPTRGQSSRNAEQQGQAWLQMQGQSQQALSPSNLWMQGQHNAQQFRLFPQQYHSQPQHGLYPLAAWQQGQLGQGPPSNGSTSNLSSIDAFSPFPPTPSTNSSVGAPSPAPSISGSSTSAAGRDDEPRRSDAGRSSESSNSNRGSMQNFQQFQHTSGGAGSSSTPSLGPRHLQQQPQSGNHDSAANTPGSSRAHRAQPEGRRGMQGGGSTGRLNVGDRTLFDPNGGSSPSPKAGNGRNAGSGASRRQPPRSQGSTSAESDSSLAKVDQPPLPEPGQGELAGYPAAGFYAPAQSSNAPPYAHWPEPGPGPQNQYPYQHYVNGAGRGAPMLQSTPPAASAMGVPSIRFPGQQPHYHPGMMVPPQPPLANLANGNFVPGAGPPFHPGMPNVGAMPGSSPSHVMGSTLRLGSVMPAQSLSGPSSQSPKNVNNSLKGTSQSDRTSPAPRPLEIRPPSSLASTSPGPKAETESSTSAGTSTSKSAHTLGANPTASSSLPPPPQIPGLPARPDWVLRASNANTGASLPPHTKAQAPPAEEAESAPPQALAEAGAQDTIASHPPPALQAPTDRSGRPMIVGDAAGPTEPFPIYVSGPVQRGFGRGGKDLGCPTANLPSRLLRGASASSAAASALADAPTGVYFGYARIIPEALIGRADENEDKARRGSGSGSEETGASAPAQVERTPLSDADTQVHPMVMSLGWNPFFANKTKTAEVHLLHGFSADFYGLEMRVVVLGYIRPEYDYVSAEALREDIDIDKQVAVASLQRATYQHFADDDWLWELDAGKGAAWAGDGAAAAAPTAESGGESAEHEGAAAAAEPPTA